MFIRSVVVHRICNARCWVTIFERPNEVMVMTVKPTREVDDAAYHEYEQAEPILWFFICFAFNPLSWR